MSRFDERFRDGQYFLVSFLFAPRFPARAQSIVKVGARAPCPVIPAPLQPLCLQESEPRLE